MYKTSKLDLDATVKSLLTCHLFPLIYHRANGNDCDYVKARANIIRNTFVRQTMPDTTYIM